MRLIKMSVAKKIGAKQLKKMAPYKNDSGQKNLNQTAQDKKMRLRSTSGHLELGPRQTNLNQTAQDKKNAPYKNDSGQKNRSQTIEDKTWHLIKMSVAKKI